MVKFEVGSYKLKILDNKLHIEYNEFIIIKWMRGIRCWLKWIVNIKK